jgi:acetolactate synthase regulatory subunit
MLDDWNCFFHLLGPGFDMKGLSEIRPSIHRLIIDGENESIADLAISDVEKGFDEAHYLKSGCDVTLKSFEVFPLADHLIEENCTMLSEEQKQRIKGDSRYQNIDEALAVAVLKRRLEIEGAQYRQQHESAYVSIRTERLGRSFRISWQFKPGAPQGYDLLGFRKSGSGFYANQFDETNNGELVVQDAKSNQTIEVLPEGQTYFYTFMLKPWHPGEGKSTYGIARFQVTIATREETETIERTLKRIEQGVGPRAANQQLAKAIDALGSFVEFEAVFDSTLKTLIAQVEKAGYSPEEKQEKVARLRDMGAVLREEYQQ